MPGLTRGEFDWSGVGLTTLKLIQNERLIEFYGGKNSIIYHINPEMIDWNVFLPSQIAVFCDHQYLWKETISALYFLNRDYYQRKVPSKSTTVGWM